MTVIAKHLGEAMTPNRVKMLKEKMNNNNNNNNNNNTPVIIGKIGTFAKSF